MGGAKTPLDRLRSKKKPYTRSQSIVCDVALADDFDAAQVELQEVRSEIERFGILDRSVPSDLARKLDDAQALVDVLEPKVLDATETFVFRAIRREDLDALLDEHAPPDSLVESNRAKGLPAPEWNPESFPAALCAACCVSHEFTVDDWKVLWHDADEFSSAELNSLFNAAYTANSTMRVVDMGKGSAAKRR